MVAKNMAVSTRNAAGPAVPGARTLARGVLIGMALVIVLLGTARAASAQTGGALRVGVGSQPSQLWGGGHLQVDPLRPLRLRFDFEGGMGTELSVGGTAWVMLVAPLGRHPLSLYAGAGSTAVLASGDATSGRHTGGGGIAALGVSRTGGMFAEVLVPFSGADRPSARVMVGYVFTRR